MIIENLIMAAAALTMAAGASAASLDSIHNRIKTGFLELRNQVVKEGRNI